MRRLSCVSGAIGVWAVAAAVAGCGGGGGSGGTGGGAEAGAAGSTGSPGVGGGSLGGQSGQTAGTTGTATGGGGGLATAGAGGNGGLLATGGNGGTAGGIGGAAGAGGVHATGGAGGTVPTPASAQELCTQFCSRLSTCDTARDQQTCLYSCRDSNSALFPNLRTELVSGIASCVQKDDCATLDQSTSLGACVTQAAAALAPSTAGSAFCSALQNADAQCGITLNPTSCLNSIKLYSDATIAQAMACVTKSCSLIYSCVSATLGQATGTWSLGGGMAPGQKCSGTAYPCSYFYDQASCQTAGCAYSGTCSGTVYCQYQYTSTSCGAVTGCTWNSTAGTCSGTPSATCASLGGTTSTTCSQYYSCFFSSQCTGTTAACTTLTVASCASHSGCMVVDAN